MSKQQRVLNFLEDGRWALASDIKQALGISPRALRKISENTGLLIAGNNGYRRADRATSEERDAYRAQLISRATILLVKAGRV